MDYDSFLNWLLQERKMSNRAAKDVVSRCKRVCKMTNENSISFSTLDRLNSSNDFLEKSMYIKSQLRRAVTLWNTYKELNS